MVCLTLLFAIAYHFVCVYVCERWPCCQLEDTHTMKVERVAYNIAGMQIKHARIVRLEENNTFRTAE